MFYTFSHFHPNLIVTSKDRSLLLEYSSVICSTHLCKYWTKVIVTERDKNSKLIMDKSLKSFLVQAPDVISTTLHRLHNFQMGPIS